MSGSLYSLRMHCQCHFQGLIRMHFSIIRTTPVAASSFRIREVVESHWNLTEITTPEPLKWHLSSVTQWAMEKDILPCPFQEFLVPHNHVKNQAVSTWCGCNLTHKPCSTKTKHCCLFPLLKLFTYQMTIESKSSTITGRNQSWRLKKIFLTKLTLQ